MTRGLRARTIAWQAMQRLEVFAIPDLQAAVKEEATRDFLEKYVHALWKQEYLSLVQPANVRGGKAKYRLVRSTGPQAPILRRDRQTIDDPNIGRSPDLYSRIWQAARRLKTFSVVEIGLCVRDEGESATDNGAIASYASALKRAGYLANGGKSGFKAEYRLIRDTGPLAPAYISHKKQVFDFNTGITHDISNLV